MYPNLNNIARRIISKDTLALVLLVFSIIQCGKGVNRLGGDPAASPFPTVSGVITPTPYTRITSWLYWDKATDDVTAQSALEYTVYFSTSNNIQTAEDAQNNGTQFGTWTADIDSMNVTGLTANTSYYFTVLVRDEDENISAYTSVNRTTDEFCGGGPGTNSGNAWQVCTLANLNSMRDDLNAYYQLSNDIDASDTSNWHRSVGWEPVGTDASRFFGGFNGQYNVISNLFINRPSTDYVGLFGRNQNSAANSMTNIGMRDVNITGNDYVGALSGYIGFVSDTADSYSTGRVSGNEYVGGLAGQTMNDLTRCFSTADITATGTRAGGLVGLFTNNRTLTRSFATGDVSGADQVGGLAGTLSGDITYSFATGNVTGTANGVGGLIGYSDAGANTVQYSFATGNVKGASSTYVGGLIGNTDGNNTVEYTFATGHVQGSSNVGGLLGRVGNSSTVRYSLATGRVSGTTDVGTAIGREQGTVTFTRVYGYDRSSTNCLATDAGETQCIHVETGTIKPFDEISFSPVLDYVDLKQREGNNLRKISQSDESAYRLWGGCNSEGATINITGALSTSTTCENFSWEVTLDFSGLAEGSQVINVDQAGSGTKTITLEKETSFCESNTTDNIHGFAGPDANNGSTEALAYRICTATQFEKMRDDTVDTNFYRLMNNVDLSAMRTPLGNDTASDCTSRACMNFDGNGFIAKNMIIVAPSSDHIAMFGNSEDFQSPRQFFKNFGMEDSYISGNNRAGLLLGYPTYVNVTDVYVDGAAIGQTNLGGIMGFLAGGGSVTGSFSNANLIGTSAIGGIIGRGNVGSFDKSYASGNITNVSGNSGGFIGFGGDDYTESFATGHVVGSNQIGGFLGADSSGFTCTDCYATGSQMTPGNAVGGFAGRKQTSAGTGAEAMTNVYASGHAISSGSNAGGFIGNLAEQNKTISNGFSLGAVGSGGAGVGGFCGEKEADAGNDIINSYYWDHTNNPTALCVGEDNASAPTGCTSDASVALPSRFTGNTGVAPSLAPLTSWDFVDGSGEWEFVGTGVLPTLQWQTP